MALLTSELVGKIGRHFFALTSCTGILICLSMQTICIQQCRADQTHTHRMLTFILLFYAPYDLVFTLLIVSYMVEILPYHLHATGLICSPSS